MPDELLDLVDDNDNVIGTQWRSEFDANGSHHARAVNAFIVNDEGKLWIPRRTAQKKRFPNALDMSVGGLVAQGESYEVGFRRETQEEINVDIDAVPWRDLGVLMPPRDGVNAFMHVYEIRMNDVPNYNHDDFSEFFWLTPQELLEKLAHDPFPSKGDLPILVRKFYGRT